MPIVDFRSPAEIATAAWRVGYEMETMGERDTQDRLAREDCP